MENKQQLVGEKTPTESKPPTETQIPAEQLFTTLLKDNNIVINLGVPNVKRVDGGGLVIDAPNVLISYGRTEEPKS